MSAVGVPYDFYPCLLLSAIKNILFPFHTLSRASLKKVPPDGKAVYLPVLPAVARRF